MIRLVLKNDAGEELEVLDDVTTLDLTAPHVWAYVAGAISQTLLGVAAAVARNEEPHG